MLRCFSLRLLMMETKYLRMLDFSGAPLWSRPIDGGFISTCGGNGVVSLGMRQWTLNGSMRASKRMSLNEKPQVQHSAVLLLNG